jgi:hypothetical protein
LHTFVIASREDVQVAFWWLCRATLASAAQILSHCTKHPPRTKPPTRMTDVRD